MEQEFGNGWVEGVHPEDLDLCIKTYVTAFDNREPFLMDYRLKNSIGEYRWISDFGRPFYDLDNTFLGYIGSCYDITKNKENEHKLIESNATKDKFLSIITHDLKSPFSSIIGFSEHLMEMVSEENYERIGEFAGIIHKSSIMAMDLLTNLTEWAQSQSGRMEFNPENLEMSTLVSEVTSLFHDFAGQKSIFIANTLLPGIHAHADKAMIGTVLRNLISNAMKFTQPGGRIIISAESGQTELTVAVSDNGVGISEERVEKLFKLKETVSTTGTHKEKGTGLGLIICRELIEKNRGKLWVESKVGIGSAFYFSLPLRIDKSGITAS